MGELQLAIIAKLLPRGILRFHGYRQAFTGFFGVCYSWDIVGVETSQSSPDIW